MTSETVAGSSSFNEINWTPENEVCLFNAMRGQKPTGINKHFHMMSIHKKFCDSYGQQISSEKLWLHLNTMYNMKALDDSEICPVRNIVQEFKLPSEILNFKYDQTRYALEESGQDDDYPQKFTSTPKANRKRPRGSPAPVTAKRRRQ